MSLNILRKTNTQRLVTKITLPTRGNKLSQCLPIWGGGAVLYPPPFLVGLGPNIFPSLLTRFKINHVLEKGNLLNFIQIMVFPQNYTLISFFKCLQVFSMSAHPNLSMVHSDMKPQYVDVRFMYLI